jgi:hypothetical protein
VTLTDTASQLRAAASLLDQLPPLPGLDAALALDREVRITPSVAVSSAKRAEWLAQVVARDGHGWAVLDLSVVREDAVAHRYTVLLSHTHRHGRTETAVTVRAVDRLSYSAEWFAARVEAVRGELAPAGPADLFAGVS